MYLQFGATRDVTVKLFQINWHNDCPTNTGQHSNIGPTLGPNKFANILASNILTTFSQHWFPNNGFPILFQQWNNIGTHYWIPVKNDSFPILATNVGPIVVWYWEPIFITNIGSILGTNIWLTLITNIKPILGFQYWSNNGTTLVPYIGSQLKMTILPILATNVGPIFVRHWV